MDMSTEAVYLVDVTAGDAESGMVSADRLLIGCFEQAVNLRVCGLGRDSGHGHPSGW
jgi:hypothetical protein